VTIECLPGSTLPDELRKVGYDVTEIGEGKRILPTAIVEKFVTRAGGELEPPTKGSTRPIMSTVTHAGIVKVKRYAFTIADYCKAVDPRDLPDAAGTARPSIDQGVALTFAGQGRRTFGYVGPIWTTMARRVNSSPESEREQQNASLDTVDFRRDSCCGSGKYILHSIISNLQLSRIRHRTRDSYGPRTPHGGRPSSFACGWRLLGRAALSGQQS
jgi:hypothetical protein